MKKTLKIVCATGILTFALGANASNQTQISRYSTVENKPTAAQINPLLAVAQYKFASNVRTVGGAISQVLSTSGYKIADDEKLNKDAKQVMDLPLPLVDRQLGPLTIKDTVAVLIGQNVFDIKVDPLHRTINFRVKPTIAKSLGA